jgi:hypothetical protein
MFYTDEQNVRANVFFFSKSDVTPSVNDINQSTELHRRENVVNFASKMQRNLRNSSPYNKPAVFLDKVKGLIKFCISEVSERIEGTSKHQFHKTLKNT